VADSPLKSILRLKLQPPCMIVMAHQG